MSKNPRVVVPAMMALLILAVTMASGPALADVDAEVEAELEGSGDLIVVGTTKVDHGEAKLTRTAIDSKITLPTIGFLGTGNGDGVVNSSEGEAYIEKAIETGLVNKAFETGIVRVTEDGKAAGMLPWLSEYLLSLGDDLKNKAQPALEPLISDLPTLYQRGLPKGVTVASTPPVMTASEIPSRINR